MKIAIEAEKPKSCHECRFNILTTIHVNKCILLNQLMPIVSSLEHIPYRLNGCPFDEKAGK